MNRLKTTCKVTEIDSFSDTVLRLFEADERASQDEFLKGRFGELRSLSDEITAAIKNRGTSVLDERDAERDHALRNLQDLISGYLVFPFAEKKAAAENLQKIFAKYGKKIACAPYAEESSLIESLLMDFDAEGAKKDVEALDGMAELVAELRAAQDDFNKTYDKQAAEKALPSRSSASQIAKSIAALVNDKIGTYLDAMQVAREDDFATFAALFEAEIKKANSKASARHGKQKSEPAAD